MVDGNKYAYFLAKYKSLDEGELNELAPRVNELADEAAAALRAVLAERGIAAPEVSTRPPDEPRDLSDEERREQSRLSSDLWNGPLAKQVRGLIAAQALVFSYGLIGSQGLNMGALPLVAVAAVLMYFAARLGKTVTRSICADATATIEAKTKSLKSLSLWLWPAFLLSSAAGIGIARALG